MAVIMTSPIYLRNVKLPSANCTRSDPVIANITACLHRTACTFGLKRYSWNHFVHKAEPYMPQKFRRMDSSIGSSVDGSGLDPSPTNSTNGATRLVRAFQALRNKLSERIQEIRKNLPMKLFFFLVGFYCATAFATVIGQTGDWDILSAALAVVVVEGIGALMYRASLPLFGNIRSLITMFNYWKAGLSLGLFLDSFKYEVDNFMDDIIGLSNLFNFELDVFSLIL